MAVDISQTLAQIANIPGQALGQGLAKAGQLYGQRKADKTKAAQQQQLLNLKQMEAKKTVMQDYSFEMAQAYQTQTGEDLDNTLAEITAKHMPNMATAGVPKNALEALSTGDYPTKEQVIGTAKTNKDYADQLIPEKPKEFAPKIAVGGVYNKKGDYIGSGFTKDGIAQIQLGDGKTRPLTAEEDFLPVQVQASKARDVSGQDEAYKTAMKATKTTQEAIRENNTQMQAMVQQQGRFLQILEDPNFETGSLTEIAAKFGNLLSGVGMEGLKDALINNDISAAYEAMGLGADVRLEKLNNIKGNASVAELNVVKEAGASIDNPKQAAVMKIKMSQAMAAKAQRKEEALDDYLTSHDYKTVGFAKEWRQYEEKHPMFIKPKGSQVMFYDESRQAFIDQNKAAGSTESQSSLEKQFDEAWYNMSKR